ncbi:MAG: hypothetical protein RSF68_02510 [Myroides sp.]
MLISIDMDAERLNKLLQKREHLQVRIRFNDFVKLFEEDFKEILKELQFLNIHYSIASWRCVPQEFHSLLAEYIQKDSFLKSKFAETKLLSNDDTVETLLNAFPSVNYLRYVPDLKIMGRGTEISALIQPLLDSYEMERLSVYFCWLKYPVILEMDILEFAELVNGEILGFWHGDLVVFPTDFTWLLTYSVEDEWRFGIK